MLTLKEFSKLSFVLIELEIFLICTGVSFHISAPEWKRFHFENSRFFLGISRSNQFLIELLDISDL